MTFSLPKACAQVQGPWDLGNLQSAPPYRWHNPTNVVRSLVYNSEPYQGTPTEIFAYYSTPGLMAAKPDSDRSLPAVVLVHGGRGKAYDRWVKMWAKRGYAAIAMNLSGHPQGDETNSGPPQEKKFMTPDHSPQGYWSYHAVANVIRAHSLLRAFPEVDPNRIAIIGVSWGGYVTCLAASLDDRFAAAVSIYGCGFLAEGSYWVDDLNKMPDAERRQWLDFYEPAHYLAQNQVPLLFVTGATDPFYPLETYIKSFNLVQSFRNLSVRPSLKHSQETAENLLEVKRFVDQSLQNGPSLPVVTQVGFTGNQIQATVSSEVLLVQAQLHYTSQSSGSNVSHPNPDSDASNPPAWTSYPATIRDGIITAQRPPEGTRIWFLTVMDEQGAVVSSTPIFTDHSEENSQVNLSKNL